VKKNNGNNGNSNETATETVFYNRTLKFSAFATVVNPTRASYRIAGHPGCLVIERSLFLNPDEVPQELTVSVDLVSPRANVKVGSEEKEAAKVAKAQEKAEKAALKLEEQKAKLLAASAKATAALEAAQARAEAAAQA